MILNNMGEIYRGLGQPKKALASFQAALPLFEQESDPFAVGIALSNIGAVYHALGDYSQALEFYEKGLAIATEIEDAVGIGQTLLNMGAVYEKLANCSQALQLYNQELEMMTAIGRLHDLLINPIADLLPSNPENKVIFIPHEELFFVPFPALIDESDRYLIEKHTMLTAPAIQVLKLTRQLAQNRTISNANNNINNPTNALVVGNPVMPEYSMQPGEEAKQLPDLPHKEAEAIAIASMLNTQPLIGSAATKAAVLQRIGSAAIVHLATHGFLDDFTESGSGFLGAIALTPSEGDRGFLTSEEIIGLNLTASLVVLSACNTGGGKITGDGIIGLSRAFIGAGAESIIVSLWQADDKATAKLMQEFYRILPQTGDSRQAIRFAKSGSGFATSNADNKATIFSTKKLGSFYPDGRICK